MSRQVRADVRLTALEAEYRDLLVEGLRECAGGRWGLLGAPTSPELRRYQPAVLEELGALADRISDLRSVTGHSEPFDLHARLLDERTQHDENQPGEPRRAALWLNELSET